MKHTRVLPILFLVFALSACPKSSPPGRPANPSPPSKPQPPVKPNIKATTLNEVIQPTDEIGTLFVSFLTSEPATATNQIGQRLSEALTTPPRESPSHILLLQGKIYNLYKA